jgi:hypothetical protein
MRASRIGIGRIKSGARAPRSGKHRGAIRGKLASTISDGRSVRPQRAQSEFGGGE